MPESAKRALAENANPGSDQLVGRDRPQVHDDPENSQDQAVGALRPLVRASRVLMHAARRVWPRKTSAHLSFVTGQTLRAAERQLANERELSTEAFVALLRSEEGFAFLDAVMTAIPAHARPAWWRRLQRSASRAEIRRRQQALAREIERIDREEQLDLELRLRGPGG